MFLWGRPVFLPDLTSQNRLLSLDIRNRTRKTTLRILDFGKDGLFEARVPRGLGEARVPHGRARVPSGAARVPPSSECHTLVEDGSEFLGRTIGEGEIVSTLKVLATGKVMDGAGRLLVFPLGEDLDFGLDLDSDVGGHNHGLEFAERLDFFLLGHFVVGACFADACGRTWLFCLRTPLTMTDRETGHKERQLDANRA